MESRCADETGIVMISRCAEDGIVMISGTDTDYLLTDNGIITY